MSNSQDLMRPSGCSFILRLKSGRRRSRKNRTLSRTAQANTIKDTYELNELSKHIELCCEAEQTSVNPKDPTRDTCNNAENPPSGSGDGIKCRSCHKCITESDYLADTSSKASSSSQVEQLSVSSPNWKINSDGATLTGKFKWPTSVALQSEVQSRSTHEIVVPLYNSLLMRRRNAQMAAINARKRHGIYCEQLDNSIDLSDLIEHGDDFYKISRYFTSSSSSSCNSIVFSDCEELAQTEYSRQSRRRLRLTSNQYDRLISLNEYDFEYDCQDLVTSEDEDVFKHRNGSTLSDSSDGQSDAL